MKTMKIPTILLTAALIASILIISTNANASHGKRNSIVGTWLLEVNTGFPQSPPITALVTFERGGTMVVSQNGIHENSEAFDPVCGCNATNGHGVWKRVGLWKYEFKFTFFLFAGPRTAGLPVNLSEPVTVVGQHVGYGLVKDAKVIVYGNKLVGKNVGIGFNLEGENINPALGPFNQTFKAKRLTVHGNDLPIFN